MQQPPIPGTPYGLPPAGGPPTGPVRDKVLPPAIALIVVGGLGLLQGVLGVISRFVNLIPQSLMNDPNVQRALENEHRGGIFGPVIVLALSALIVLAGVQLMKLRSYGLVMAGSIAALIPCCGPCCFLAIPFGIWSLVVINSPEVKSAFRA